MSFFCVEHLFAGYAKKQILRDVSFSLETGTVMGILGANGSGKTTLIKAVCGILPHEGSCLLEGTKLESLPPRELAKHVSYIPQRSGISIDISALDVVLMGFNPRLKLLEHPTRAMIASAREALSRVGLGEMEDINYLYLSEGQKQLCILARTIVSGSRLLLLDEPESALDFQHRHRMLDLLRDWTDRTRGGAVVSLHDPMLALNYCDTLMVLKNGAILDIFAPREAPLDKMEQVLNQVYGQVSLHWCTTRAGRKVLTMLKEEP